MSTIRQVIWPSPGTLAGALHKTSEKYSSESEPESSILTGFRNGIRTESIFCTRKLNHHPEWRTLRRCAVMLVCSHPQASEGRQLSARFYLWQRIVLENELACGWLSECGRHSKRPGPARASLVRIRSGFLSGFCSESRSEPDFKPRT